MSEWKPIGTTPNVERLLMFHQPGKDRPQFCRGDDFCSGYAWFLSDCTHWQELPPPPEVEE